MSLRVCLVMGCLLNVAGAGLKLGLAVALPRYGVLIAAQCVLAVAQIFLLSAPPLVADEWFPPHQRAAATAIGSMANNVGIALGMLLAPLMVTQDTSATSHDFVGFLVLQLVLSAVPLLGIVHSALSASSPVAQDSTQMNNVEVENHYSDEDVTFRKGLPVRWLSCCAALTASRDAVTAIFSLLRENHSYRCDGNILLAEGESLIPLVAGKLLHYHRCCLGNVHSPGASSWSVLSL
ncbi:MFS transporter, putative [Bodo saltans]|uniref:MFS transporter, putative n=1 Tax=Bodo saltans TaxID=75058 RepID=A0A0S4JSP8_BODSA|nr:MFS transporter, putative [Bodo saltans]|eukprot:CUG93008.1 MFS transporter, putative [Bodo saltans]